MSTNQIKIHNLQFCYDIPCENRNKETVHTHFQRNPTHEQPTLVIVETDYIGQ